jgi:predicted amidohydrolase
MIEPLGVALWATNLSVPLNGIDAWAASVDEQMARARAQGAELLVMPEYAAEQWLSFAPELAGSEEISWLAEQAPRAMEAIATLPARHGMALLAGTMPVRVRNGGARFVNRAHLLLPDGRTFVQDKLCLTPPEKDPAGWLLAEGDALQIVEWRGLRLATVICLDIELSALSARLATCDLDLILVPSMTEKLAGYARVFSCAKARAVELEVAVCAVGCVGSAATSKPRESNTSGAAVYLPCEAPLGHTGIVVQTPASDRADGAGVLTVARDLPLDAVRRLRRGAAEVWPGAWSAEHVVIRDG